MSSLHLSVVYKYQCRFGNQTYGPQVVLPTDKDQSKCFLWTSETNRREDSINAREAYSIINYPGKPVEGITFVRHLLCRERVGVGTKNCEVYPSWEARLQIKYLDMQSKINDPLVFS